MSKYQPLADFLASHKPDTWRASFSDLEKALGSALPKTARDKDAWWAELNKPHAKAWLDAGWVVDAVDLATGHVDFSRKAPPAPERSGDAVIAAAGAEYEKVKVVEAAKKAGIAAAVVGVVAGVGLAVMGLLGRRRS